MIVVERMTHNPVTITEQTTVEQALETMKERRLRHLPVLEKGENLVGIVSEKDLLRTSGDILVEEVMTRELITVTEYTALEDAARIMVDHRVSSLPVVRSGRLVGIITETDIFKVFLELLGARQQGVRLTMLVPEEHGMLASLTGEIASMGGNILALGTFRGEDPTNRLVTVKVASVPMDKLVAIMEALGMEIIDVRES